MAAKLPTEREWQALQSLLSMAGQTMKTGLSKPTLSRIYAEEI